MGGKGRERGVYFLALKRSTYEISVSYCAWPGSLIYLFSPPLPRDRVKGGLVRLGFGGGV